MEMHVVMRGDRRSIERGWFVMPVAKSGFNLFVDAVTNRLHDFCVDDIALCVDRNLNDYVAGEVARNLGAIDRIRKNDRVCNVHVVAKDWPVDKAAKRRACFGVKFASFGVRFNLSAFFGWLPFLGLPRWSR